MSDNTSDFSPSVSCEYFVITARLEFIFSGFKYIKYEASSDASHPRISHNFIIQLHKCNIQLLYKIKSIINVGRI